MRRFTAALLAVLAGALGTAGPSVAQVSETRLTCTFTTECYEAGTCSPADLAFRLSVITNAEASAGANAPPVPGLGELVQGDETQYGEVITYDSGTLFYKATYRIVRGRILSAAPSMLTVNVTGDARLTRHLTDVALAITYRGTCEEIAPAAPAEPAQE